MAIKATNTPDEERRCANCAHHPDNVLKYGGRDCGIRFHEDWWPGESTDLFLLHNPNGDDGTCEYFKELSIIPLPPEPDGCVYVYRG